MPEVEIKEVTVVARPGSARRNEYRKYERLISNVKRVYPYALMVRERLNKVNEDLKNITGEKGRKEYIKNIEKDVFADQKRPDRLTRKRPSILIFFLYNQG